MFSETTSLFLRENSDLYLSHFDSAKIMQVLQARDIKIDKKVLRKFKLGKGLLVLAGPDKESKLRFLARLMFELDNKLDQRLLVIDESIDVSDEDVIKWIQYDIIEMAMDTTIIFSKSINSSSDVRKLNTLTKALEETEYEDDYDVVLAFGYDEDDEDDEDPHYDPDTDEPDFKTTIRELHANYVIMVDGYTQPRIRNRNWVEVLVFDDDKTKAPGMDRVIKKINRI